MAFSSLRVACGKSFVHFNFYAKKKTFYTIAYSNFFRRISVICSLNLRGNLLKNMQDYNLCKCWLFLEAMELLPSGTFASPEKGTIASWVLLPPGTFASRYFCLP